MSRVIKFRAWDGKRMLADWPMLLSTDLRQPTYLNAMLKADQEKGYILMQFTGLTDKSGRDIYEGDVVRKDPWVGIVTWNEFTASYMYERVGKKTGNIDDWLYEKHRQIQVIGNIYENPDLLTNQKD